MNFRAVFAIQGLLLIFQGLFMLLPIGFSVYYGDDDLIPSLFRRAHVGRRIPAPLLFRFQGELRLKDSFATVSLAGSLPPCSGRCPSLYRAIFPPSPTPFLKPCPVSLPPEPLSWPISRPAPRPAFLAEPDPLAWGGWGSSSCPWPFSPDGRGRNAALTKRRSRGRPRTS